MRFEKSSKKNAHFFEKYLDFLEFTPIFVAEKRNNYLYNEKNTICINPYDKLLDTSVRIGGNAETEPYTSAQLVERHA